MLQVVLSPYEPITQRVHCATAPAPLALPAPSIACPKRSTVFRYPTRKYNVSPVRQVFSFKSAGQTGSKAITLSGGPAAWSFAGAQCLADNNSHVIWDTEWIGARGGLLFLHYLDVLPPDSGVRLPRS